MITSKKPAKFLDQKKRVLSAVSRNEPQEICSTASVVIPNDEVLEEYKDEPQIVPELPIHEIENDKIEAEEKMPLTAKSEKSREDNSAKLLKSKVKLVSKESTPMEEVNSSCKKDQSQR